MIALKNKLILGLLAMAMLACKTDMINRIDTEEMENGGYVRTVTPYPVLSSTFSFNKAALSSTAMSFVAEAITPNKGGYLSSYDLTIGFVDNTRSRGSNASVNPLTLKSIAASAFAKNDTTGYPRTVISVTATEALTTLKLPADSINVGDYFEIRGTMKLTTGQSFNANNTGANITGGAFYSSPFYYRVNVVSR
ncbi:hypothetical protein [Siphonobacter sp. SORGH_AS_0500]|uniref:hypothetical protein n=1 Tax=Siphonobacter sp. SORGH_AS_0500 TaxID=1864824 RepID=UPI002862EFC9|nr:hypothetical protein [Siphonobacter sp. SORGH_AS_0500]MDR6196976.1 hypothetical protein [Siphonobacter sp. SORGH_AS_0500]